LGVVRVSWDWSSFHDEGEQMKYSYGYGLGDVSANKWEITGPFSQSDFVDWTGITTDFGTGTLRNAFLTESGVRKVMGVLGLSAPVENRKLTEGFNGQLKIGTVYGPRSAATGAGDMGFWRYMIPEGGYITLDGYVNLIAANKGDIARYLFRNYNNPNVERALMYVIPDHYANAQELEKAINSVNASEAGTGTQVNLGAQSGAQGEKGSNAMSEEQSPYTSGNTNTELPKGNAVTNGPTPTNENANNGTVGFMDKKIELFGKELPLVAVLGVGAVVGFMMMKEG